MLTVLYCIYTFI